MNNPIYNSNHLSEAANNNLSMSCSMLFVGILADEPYMAEAIDYLTCFWDRSTFMPYSTSLASFDITLSQLANVTLMWIPLGLWIAEMFHFLSLHRKSVKAK